MVEQQFASIQHKKLSTVAIAKRAVFITLGSVFTAIGLEIFLVPNSVIDGGVTGISIMLSRLLGVPLGLFIFLLNIPFFYLGRRQIGKTFAVSSFCGVLILSISTFMLHPIHAFTDDILLATIFGGIIVGIGVGIVIRFGGALDGTEILAILFNKKSPFSVGEIILFINIFIFATAGFVFSWDRAMYSMLAYVIVTKTIDVVVQGMNESKSVWIISDKSQEIGEAILARLGRGVTYLKGEGAFTGDNKRVVFSIITRLEEAKLKTIVEEIDQAAFLAIGDIADVSGGHLKKKDIH